MHVRTNLRSGQAANPSEENIQDVCNAVTNGIQAASQAFDPFKLAGMITNQTNSVS